MLTILSDRNFEDRTAVKHAPIDREERADFERAGTRLTMVGAPDAFADWYRPIDWTRLSG